MKTALYDRHLALKAKMVSFAGWDMPLQYQGIIPEHHAVRKAAGIFDVSHMGRILVSGKEAEKFLDYLSTNKIGGKADKTATYTVWCHPNGGSVDDVIVYKIDQEHFFVIVNAANKQKDLEHMQKYVQGFSLELKPLFETDGILAIQGPEVEKFLPEAKGILPMHFSQLQPGVFIAGTGYTGAGGVEIYGPNAHIVEMWDRLIKAGITPIGLGARDTLRLEKGYALYGHELSDEITPLESVSSWTVKMNKEKFIGKEALAAKPPLRSAYGIILIGKGIAREGYDVFKEDHKIGIVTSGTHSPTLDKAIALILVDRKLTNGDIVEVQIRQNRIPAKVTPLPFVK